MVEFVVKELGVISKQLKGDYIPGVISNVRACSTTVEITAEVVEVIHALLKQLKATKPKQ